MNPAQEKGSAVNVFFIIVNIRNYPAVSFLKNLRRPMTGVSPILSGLTKDRFMESIEPLIFEYSVKGRKGWTLPKLDVKPDTDLIPEEYLRKDNNLPELSEIDVMRHFIHLSLMNHHIDKGFYPLGSCTMKYNPKINEDVSRFEGFTELHPLEPVEYCQGALHLMYELQEYLKIIAGVDAVTLQPAAGAQGELTGMLIVRKHFEKKKEKRITVLIPDSAHGTNPASVTLSGFSAQEIKSNNEGLIDIENLSKVVEENTACLMLTNPNTLGLFEKDLLKISEILHKKGALLYLDGANLNAYLGYHRPGDGGCDLVHFNLHKTFSTPHGGGGPGSGPLGVKKFLEPYLPVPIIKKETEKYTLDYNRPDSIGKIQSFYGNFLIMVRAYTYIRMLGVPGLKEVSECAVINANYLMRELSKDYELPYKSNCMHEFVLSGKNLLENGVKTLDIAKRLLDFGIHSPTIYFPLIVSEALMIEPTETESKDSLDNFVSVMRKIREEVVKNPSALKLAPYNTPVRRLDEAKASRELDVRYQCKK